jgi:hypothetical protein
VTISWHPELSVTTLPGSERTCSRQEQPSSASPALPDARTSRRGASHPDTVAAAAALIGQRDPRPQRRSVTRADSTCPHRDALSTHCAPTRRVTSKPRHRQRNSDGRAAGNDYRGPGPPNRGGGQSATTTTGPWPYLHPRPHHCSDYLAVQIGPRRFAVKTQRRFPVAPSFVELMHTQTLNVGVVRLEVVTGKVLEALLRIDP